VEGCEPDWDKKSPGRVLFTTVVEDGSKLPGNLFFFFSSFHGLKKKKFLGRAQDTGLPSSSVLYHITFFFFFFFFLGVLV